MITHMNPLDGLSPEKEAVLDYNDSDFIIVKPGDFVRCAVTGKRVTLEALRYWNVDKQEAYIDAEAAMQGFGYNKN